MTKALGNTQRKNLGHPTHITFTHSTHCKAKKWKQPAQKSKFRETRVRKSCSLQHIFDWNVTCAASDIYLFWRSSCMTVSCSAAGGYSSVSKAAAIVFFSLPVACKQTPSSHRSLPIS